MSTTKRVFSYLCPIVFLLFFQSLHAQDPISWLDDFTGDMQMGSETYRYNFTNVDGNDCKLKFEEQVTDKKGSVETHSWIFYLSDMDPSAIRFKVKGKSISVSMEVRMSQKFISYYKEGEFDEFTEEIKISMNEVDKSRSFIEAIKENINHCKETQVTWENRDQALTWLVSNVGKATDDDIEWDQKFEPGNRPYLVDYQVNSVNEKDEQELFNYRLDLSDINPLAINLKISGKSLIAVAQVREGKKFIKVKTPTGTEFTNELLIYANEIELARQIINALTYVVNNTKPERTQWDSYAASLGFVKDNLEEVNIDDELFANSLNYEDSPSSLVNLIIRNSESDGSSEQVKYSFYLADMMDQLKLEVSKSSITIEMATKNKREFIRESVDEKVTDYSSSLGFHVSEIDMARDLIHAFEYAIGNSKEGIKEFSNISEVGFWFSKNIGSIEADGDTYEQNLAIAEENENQLTLELKQIEADGEDTDSRYILYPEDISLDELEVKVSGKKLAVPLETEKGKYIRKFENGKLQNFTGTAETLFIDPLAAKNYIASIRFLKENSVVENRADMSKDEAIASLSGNIQNIELSDEQHEQKIEIKDDGKCKLSFTRLETDAKGASTEYLYEFIVSDIHPGSSNLLVKGEIIEINLVARGNQKLIKPYKNGETGDFEDEFTIYADDVLIAKKILAAFTALSEVCK